MKRIVIFSLVLLAIASVAAGAATRTHIEAKTSASMQTPHGLLLMIQTHPSRNIPQVTRFESLRECQIMEAAAVAADSQRNGLIKLHTCIPLR